MSITSDLLFAYLREVFYGRNNASIDLDKIDGDFVTFSKGLMFFAQCFCQCNDFSSALARGDLSVMPPPPENELAAPLKSLHASLKHLTWQSKQVALGDYKQRVDFMGEFADAFNTMIEQLSDRQEKLENEISVSQNRAKALEQSNLLLSNLTRHIPQQIFVVATEDQEILLLNETARIEICRDPDYVTKVMDLLPEVESVRGSHYTEMQLDREGEDLYLAVNSYYIEWDKTDAVALVLSDVSAEKKQRMELEDQAYRDALTRAYNRFYGMITLSDWVSTNKKFALVFVDLDSLKYVNDAHGHNEGDEYIIRVSDHLRVLSPDAVVCRLGGDEFMLLIPGIDEDGARRSMVEISEAIEHDEHLNGKDYSYSISFGIIAVDKDNSLPSSTILSIADERMFEHKRARKKERRDMHA